MNDPRPNYIHFVIGSDEQKYQDQVSFVDMTTMQN